MRKRRLRKDPVSYRIEYSRLVQDLHAAADPPASPPATLRLTLDGEVVAAVEAAERSVSALERRRPDPNDAPASLDKEPKDDPGEIARERTERALELVEKAMRELRRLGWKWSGGEPPWYVRWARLRNGPEDRLLGEFLDRVLEPAAVVLYWSCRVAQQEPLPRSGPLERRRSLGEGWLGWRKRRFKRRRLRLWDRCPRLPQNQRWIRHRERWLADYLVILGDPEVVKADDLPRPYFPRRFLAWLGLTRLRPAPAPSYRVRYNVACLLSRLAGRDGASLDEALDQLAFALTTVRGARREAIVQWACRDPSLEALRKSGDEEARARFREITGRDEPPPGERRRRYPPWPSNL